LASAESIPETDELEAVSLCVCPFRALQKERNETNIHNVKERERRKTI